MATVYYVNGTSGSDAADGLTPATAKQTILGARDACTGGDLIVIDPGVYLELNSTWSNGARDHAVYMANPLKPGNVIVDFQNVEGIHWSFNPENPIFVGIHFRNPGILSTSHLFSSRTNTQVKWYNCVFYNQYGSQQGRVIETDGSASPQPWFQNCTFYNFDEGMYANYTPTFCYNNYIENCATPVVGAVQYNAFPGGTGTNIDTNTVNPGLRDPTGLDFRLDQTTVPADYQAFMVGGQQGDRIGAMAMGGFYYSNIWPALRFLSADPTPAQGNPQPSWENEGPNGSNTFATGTPTDVIEDGTTFALRLDLDAVPAATGGRIRSPVYDMGADGAKDLASIALRKYEAPADGAIIDNNTALPAKFEYRSSNTVFAIGDPSPSWVETDPQTALSDTDRYAQVRITFQTAHPNT